jgi:hypothetical protein
MNQSIDPQKEYALASIVEMRVMGRTYPTVVKRILEDRLGENILKTEIVGSPDAKRYKILGTNLIKYLHIKTLQHDRV